MVEIGTDVRNSGGKIATQGLLITGGVVAAQILSFARNASLGYLLSKGDFGIAATLTITLQMFEILSDVAVDRLLVQAEDGDSDHLLANAHTILVARGLLIAAIMAATAPLLAHFFGLPDATWAFVCLAALPAIKAFMHLDPRRQQRNLDNRSLMLIEVIPQAVAVACIYPALMLTQRFDIVLWLAAIQTTTSVAMSHILARAPYAVAFDKPTLLRFWNFGLPILLSAIPLFAVYQGDRMLVARTFGMEVLAGYSAAFMLTMLPGIFAYKLGLSLMLPVLSRAREEGTADQPAQMMREVVTLFAALYLCGFILAGGEVMALTFGPKYTGLHTPVALLAIMWALRIVQVTPNTIVLATGNTRPLLIAGTMRAAALLPAMLIAVNGGSLEAIIMCGIAGELVSVFYLLNWTQAETANRSLSQNVGPVTMLATLAAAMAFLHTSLISGLGRNETIGITACALLAVAALFFWTRPTIRTLVMSLMRQPEHSLPVR